MGLAAAGTGRAVGDDLVAITDGRAPAGVVDGHHIDLQVIRHPPSIVRTARRGDKAPQLLAGFAARDTAHCRFLSSLSQKDPEFARMGAQNPLRKDS
jgi:hypothetical protein